MIDDQTNYPYLNPIDMTDDDELMEDSYDDGDQLGVDNMGLNNEDYAEDDLLAELDGDEDPAAFEEDEDLEEEDDLETFEEDDEDFFDDEDDEFEDEDELDDEDFDDDEDDFDDDDFDDDEDDDY